MLPEKTLLLMRGIPASGKTTWVKENVNPDNVVRLDDIRYMLYGNILWQDGYLYLSDDAEMLAWSIANEAVFNRMYTGQSVVIDSCFCYKQETLNRVLSKFKRCCELLGFKLMYKQLDTPLEECLERSKHRSNREPSQDDIRLMYSRMMSATMPDFITKLQ